MSIRIDGDILQKASQKSPEVALYLEDQNYRYKNISSDDLPIKILKVVLEVWEKELFDRHSKFEDEGEEPDYRLKSDMESFASLKHTIEISTKKLKNKSQSLSDLKIRLKAIFELELGDRGWIYKKNGEHYTPLLVRDVIYYPKDRYRHEAAIEVKFAQNNKNKTNKFVMSIDKDMLKSNGKDAYQVLASLNLHFETDELHEKYREGLKDYHEKCTWEHKQVLSGGKRYINDNNHYIKHGENKWENSFDYYAGRNSGVLHIRLSSEFNLKEEGLEVPFAFDIYCYNLGEHKYDWIDARDMELYKYNTDLDKKLILPEDHKDLIDILLSEDLGDLGNDVIEGKGMGTLVLTKGKPGLGKTLTAEIVSEKKEIPLYSVHSGQFGVKGEELEKKLKWFLQNAERWGCILLLDEADVYIRVRDNDVNHNAIVATFLRVLEYYSGVLFMTTNRVDDVDEAIESRCTAVLRYELPTEETTVDLWNLYINQFNLEVDKTVVPELVEKMGRLSGRDIKNIAMLTRRFTLGKSVKKVTAKHFETCATFRGKFAIGGKK